MESSETLENLWKSLRIQDFALFQKQNISVPYFGNISQKAEQKCPILGKILKTEQFCSVLGKILRTEQNCSVLGRSSTESKRILWNLRHFRESQGILGCRESYRIP
jgi:hypothetical protein